VVSLDVNPHWCPTICQDFLDWDYESWNQENLENGGAPVGFIWASPPCNSFSSMRLLPGRRGPSVEDLELSLKLVAKTFHVIAYFSQQLWASSGRILPWVVENPATGLLPRVQWLDSLPHTVVTYCQYGFPVSKPTTLWSNFLGHRLSPPCSKSFPCGLRLKNQPHTHCCSLS